MGLLYSRGSICARSAGVLIKTNLFYDVIPYARVRDQDGFTNPSFRLPRTKTLWRWNGASWCCCTQRRLQRAVPHPNDFVYDANPHLEGPYDDGGQRKELDLRRP